MAYKKSTEKSYYKVLLNGKAEGALTVKKFNPDLELLSEYEVSFIGSPNGGYYDCPCPASKFDCRHKEIIRQVKDRNEIGSERFFCFETKTFHTAETLT